MTTVTQLLEESMTPLPMRRPYTEPVAEVSVVIEATAVLSGEHGMTSEQLRSLLDESREELREVVERCVERASWSFRVGRRDGDSAWLDRLIVGVVRDGAIEMGERRI